MIQLVEGFWVNPEAVTVVKALGKEKCALWVTGQSAMDGFVLDYTAEEVVEVLNEYFDGEEDEDE